MDSAPLHLLVNMQPSGVHQAAWRTPGANRRSFVDLDYYLRAGPARRARRPGRALLRRLRGPAAGVRTPAALDHGPHPAALRDRRDDRAHRPGGQHQHHARRAVPRGPGRGHARPPQPRPRRVERGDQLRPALGAQLRPGPSCRTRRPATAARGSSSTWWTRSGPAGRRARWPWTPRPGPTSDLDRVKAVDHVGEFFARRRPAPGADPAAGTPGRLPGRRLRPRPRPGRAHRGRRLRRPADPGVGAPLPRRPARPAPRAGPRARGDPLLPRRGGGRGADPREALAKRARPRRPGRVGRRPAGQPGPLPRVDPQPATWTPAAGRGLGSPATPRGARASGTRCSPSSRTPGAPSATSSARGRWATAPCWATRGASPTTSRSGTTPGRPTASC